MNLSGIIGKAENRDAISGNDIEDHSQKLPSEGFALTKLADVLSDYQQSVQVARDPPALNKIFRDGLGLKIQGILLPEDRLRALHLGVVVQLRPARFCLNFILAQQEREDRTSK